MNARQKEEATMGSSSRSGPTSRISRRQILQAARRYYHHGETQSAIAKDMGISASYLARLLKSARDDGWVRIFIDADEESELAAELQARFPGLVHVTVVLRGATPNDTARALGSAAAEFLNDLLDRDEASGRTTIRHIAVGGGSVHRFMVDQIVPRRNRVSVGPTALTPARGKVERFTATTIATLLALRLGALTPGSSSPDEGERTGFLYTYSSDPPQDDLSALQAWYTEMRLKPAYLEMMGFWERVDVAFVGVAPVERVYRDVRDRLHQLGVHLEDMVERGAVALLANHFIDAKGENVPLTEGVDSYEPAISITQIRRIVNRDRPGYVVLDARNAEAAKPIQMLLEAEQVNVLLCDTVVAEALLKR